VEGGLGDAKLSIHSNFGLVQALGEDSMINSSNMAFATLLVHLFLYGFCFCMSSRVTFLSGFHGLTAANVSGERNFVFLPSKDFLLFGKLEELEGLVNGTIRVDVNISLGQYNCKPTDTFRLRNGFIVECQQEWDGSRQLILAKYFRHKWDIALFTVPPDSSKFKAPMNDGVSHVYSPSEQVETYYIYARGNRLCVIEFSEGAQTCHSVDDTNCDFVVSISSASISDENFVVQCSARASSRFVHFSVAYSAIRAEPSISPFAFPSHERGKLFRSPSWIVFVDPSAVTILVEAERNRPVWFSMSNAATIVQSMMLGSNLLYTVLDSQSGKNIYRTYLLDLSNPDANQWSPTVLEGDGCIVYVLSLSNQWWLACPNEIRRYYYNSTTNKTDVTYLPWPEGMSYQAYVSYVYPNVSEPPTQPPSPGPPNPSQGAIIAASTVTIDTLTYTTYAVTTSTVVIVQSTSQQCESSPAVPSHTSSQAYISHESAVSNNTTAPTHKPQEVTNTKLSIALVSVIGFLSCVLSVFIASTVLCVCSKYFGKCKRNCGYGQAPIQEENSKHTLSLSKSYSFPATAGSQRRGLEQVQQFSNQDRNVLTDQQTTSFCGQPETLHSGQTVVQSTAGQQWESSPVASHTTSQAYIHLESAVNNDTTAPTLETRTQAVVTVAPAPNHPPCTNSDAVKHEVRDKVMPSNQMPRPSAELSSPTNPPRSKDLQARFGPQPANETTVTTESASANNPQITEPPRTHETPPTTEAPCTHLVTNCDTPDQALQPRDSSVFSQTPSQSTKQELNVPSHQKPVAVTAKLHESMDLQEKKVPIQSPPSHRLCVEDSPIAKQNLGRHSSQHPCTPSTDRYIESESSPVESRMLSSVEDHSCTQRYNPPLSQNLAASENGLNHTKVPFPVQLNTGVVEASHTPAYRVPLETSAGKFIPQDSKTLCNRDEKTSSYPTIYNSESLKYHPTSPSERNSPAHESDKTIQADHCNSYTQQKLQPPSNDLPMASSPSKYQSLPLTRPPIPGSPLTTDRMLNKIPPSSQKVQDHSRSFPQITTDPVLETGGATGLSEDTLSLPSIAKKHSKGDGTSNPVS
jgi:hypothetical protein